MKRESVTKVVLTGLVVVGAVLGLYLFRVRSWDNPMLGEMTVRYQWGQARVLSVDTNRDDLIDARYLLAPETGVVNPLGSWVEGWESSSCDGSFDLHIYENSDSMLVIETDFDGDGEFRIEGRGQEAGEFLASLSRPEECRGASVPHARD